MVDGGQRLAQAAAAAGGEAAQSFEPADVLKAFQNMKAIKCSEGTAKVGGLKTYGVNNMVVQPCPLTRIQSGNIEFIGFKPLNIP